MQKYLIHAIVYIDVDVFHTYILGTASSKREARSVRRSRLKAAMLAQYQHGKTGTKNDMVRELDNLRFFKKYFDSETQQFTNSVEDRVEWYLRHRCNVDYQVLPLDEVSCLNENWNIY